MGRGATNLFVEKPLALSEHSRPAIELTNITSQTLSAWSPLTRCPPGAELPPPPSLASWPRPGWRTWSRSWRPRPSSSAPPRHTTQLRSQTPLCPASLPHVSLGTWHVMTTLSHQRVLSWHGLLSPWGRDMSWQHSLSSFSAHSPAAATSVCLGALPRLAFLSSSLCFFVLFSWLTTIGVSSASGNHTFLSILDTKICFLVTRLILNHDAREALKLKRKSDWGKVPRSINLLLTREARSFLG